MVFWRQCFLVCLLLAVHVSTAFCTTDRAIRQVKKEKAAAVGMERFYDTSAALVIGNGNYAGGWNQLPGALRDVDEVAAALKKHGFVVTLKKDLTRRGFDEELLRFIEKYGQNPDNRLLFYYSGHGHTEKRGITQDQVGYLVMVDAGHPARDKVRFRMGSVPMANLLIQAKEISSRHVLFLFDSCFSGNILNARGTPAPDYITKVVKEPVRQFITSGSAEEPVPDVSAFKTLFLDMLDGKRPEPFPDGYLTGEELGLYLKQNLPIYNHNQHPQYGKINDARLDKGDFVFFINRADISEDSAPIPTPVVVNNQSEQQAGSLNVRVTPKNAVVKILNIRPKYSPGMALAAGKYHIEAAAEGYQTRRRWVELAAGADLVVDIRLLPEVISSPAPVAKKLSVSPYNNSLPATHTDSETGMEFVFVRGGCCQMGDTFGEGAGDEKPVHEVCVDDFYMGKYEVTQGAWRKVMGNNPSYFKKGDRYPVERVSWNDVQDYIRKLNKRSGRNYRLPTEAEWEYAAKSGGKREKYAGSNSVDDVAWYNGNSGGTTHRVGTKQPNGLGLYDMSGNVWEWCQDWYDEDYYSSSPRQNPTGPVSGEERLYRGGGWYDFPWLVRAAYRFRYSPGNAGNNVGFRLSLSSAAGQ